MAFGFRRLVDAFRGTAPPSQSPAAFAANDPRYGPDTVKAPQAAPAISQDNKPSLLERARSVGISLQESVKKDWRWMAGNAAIAFAAKSLLIGSTGGIGAVIAGGIAISGLTSATVSYVKDRTREIKAEKEQQGALRQERGFLKAAKEELTAFGRHAAGGSFWKKALTTSLWSAIGAGIGFGAHEILADAAAPTAPSLPEKVPVAATPAPQEITPTAEIPAPTAPEPLTVMDQVREVLKTLPVVPSRVQDLVDKIAEGKDFNGQARKDLAVLFYNQKAGLPMTPDVKDLGRGLFEEASLAGNQQAARDLLWIDGKAAPVYDPAATATQDIATPAAQAPAPVAAESGALAYPAAEAAAPPQEVQQPIAPPTPEQRLAALAQTDKAVQDALQNAPTAKLAMECGAPIPKELPKLESGQPLVLGTTTCTEYAEDIAPGDVVRHTNTATGLTETFQYAAPDGRSEKTANFAAATLQGFVQKHLSFLGFAPAAR
jgi:hypothetical protein